MRILICGDRNWKNKDIIHRELKKFPAGTTIIHGAARGADTLACIVAKELGFKTEVYPADWAGCGKIAGPIRNQQMLDAKPDLVIAFHSDLKNSKGTKHMVKISKQKGVEVKLVTGRLRVYTSTTRYKGPNRLNITVKSGDRTFAPNWDLVTRMRNGQITEAQYKEEYYELMRSSYRKNKARWQELLNQEEVVLVCYCPGGTFCHRYILAEILEKLGALYFGEK